MKQHSPAAARNTVPIGDVLATQLPPQGVVLELASGTGEHVIAFARRFPALAWQPTDGDSAALASITAWRDEAGLPNVRAPRRLDVNVTPWDVDAASIDAVVCINMVHISPWESSLAMFAGAARALVPGGPLVVYGPFRFGGVTAPSNLAFAASLQARDPRWGVREVDDLRRVAQAAGLGLHATIAMPANNHCLVFHRAT